MTIKLPCKIKITWGKDQLKFDAQQVRIRWDKNSFQIEGIFKPDVIKVEDNGQDRKITNGNQ